MVRGNTNLPRAVFKPSQWRMRHSLKPRYIMRLHAPPILTLLAVALILVPIVAAPPAPVYTLTPSQTNLNLGSTVTFTLTLDNGANFQVYTTTTEVRKPDGSRARIIQTITTDNKGFGSTTFDYPGSSFTAVNGTVAVDVVGVYNMVVNQTAPTNTGVVATTRFTATSQLNVVINEPNAGSTVERGQGASIKATVYDVNNNPVSPASVNATSPSGETIFLDSFGSGVYVKAYQVKLNDPLGTWALQISARDFKGNSGTAGPLSITVLSSQLTVEAFSTYNSKGTPSVEFSPGDTIYPYFRIRYSTLSSPLQYLTSGTFKVRIKNLGGALVADLTAIYDPTKLGFYAPTGYSVSSFDPAGSWSVEIEAGSLDDGFGNVGPIFPTAIKVQVVFSPLGYLPFIIGGVVASLGGLVAFRRFGNSSVGFEHLETLMGGQMPRSSSLLILGDPGSGKTILSYQLLYEELESGRPCALLSYDAFPEDVHARMKEFGWDITSHLRKGRLKIIDCYSGLAGEGEGAIRDPSDLTELNIQITSFISKAKNPPTMILDSLTPIYNGVEAKQAINFLQTVGAKVKRTGGVFISTASTGAIPSESIAKIKTLMDGVIELSIVRSGRKVTRYLSVLKLERRKISSEAIPFEIDRKRGIMFRISRLHSLRSKALRLGAVREPPPHETSPRPRKEPESSSRGQAGTVH